MTTSKDAKDAAEDLSLIRQVLDKTYYNIKSISGIFMIWLLVWIASLAVQLIAEFLLVNYIHNSDIKPIGTVYLQISATFIYIIDVAVILISFAVLIFYRQIKMKNQAGYSKKILDIWGFSVLLPLIFDFIMRFKYSFTDDQIKISFVYDLQLGIISLSVFSLSFGLAMLFTGILTGRRILIIYSFVDFIVLILTLFFTSRTVNSINNLPRAYSSCDILNYFRTIPFMVYIIIKISNLLAMFIIARRSQKKEGGHLVGNQSYSGSL